MSETESRRTRILNAVQTTAVNFIAYDRKEDEDLPRGEIEAAIEAGEITLGEIGEAFLRHLREDGGLNKLSEKKVKIVGADIVHHFEIEVAEAELEAKARDIWDNPDKYHKTEESWDQFLKYLWIERPQQRSQERFSDYCQKVGIIKPI